MHWDLAVSKECYQTNVQVICISIHLVKKDQYPPQVQYGRLFYAVWTAMSCKNGHWLFLFKSTDMSSSKRGRTEKSLFKSFYPCFLQSDVNTSEWRAVNCSPQIASKWLVRSHCEGVTCKQIVLFSVPHSPASDVKSFTLAITGLQVVYLLMKMNLSTSASWSPTRWRVIYSRWVDVVHRSVFTRLLSVPSASLAHVND